MVVCGRGFALHNGQRSHECVGSVRLGWLEPNRAAFMKSSFSLVSLFFYYSHLRFMERASSIRWVWDFHNKYTYQSTSSGGQSVSPLVKRIVLEVLCSCDVRQFAKLTRRISLLCMIFYLFCFSLSTFFMSCCCCLLKISLSIQFRCNKVETIFLHLKPKIFRGFFFLVFVIVGGGILYNILVCHIIRHF